MDTDARGLPQAVVRVGQQRIARRQVLKWGLAGLGLSVAPLLAACGGGNATPPPPGAGVSGGGSAQPTVAAAGTPVGSGAGGAQTTVNFQGWDYEPPLVEQNIKRFESLNPTIKVSYTPITSAEYRQKMVAQFTANANPDGLYVRDDYFAGWVTAGYLQDIEGLPGVDKVYNLLYKHNADAMTYKGKRFGVPYYTDCFAFVYNEEMLQKGGFSAPPKSLQELEEQALKIKGAGIVEYPLSMDLGLTNDFWSTWWALIYASGAKLFDDQLNPILDKDPAVKGVMSWINKGLNDTKIIAPNSLDTATVSRDNFMAGQHAYLFIARYDIEAVNAPERSKVAGKAKMALMPGLDAPGKGTVGWTRMYCLAKNTKVKDPAFKLNYYLGGLDEKDQPYTAKFWFLNRGLGFAYKDLGGDPEIQAKLKKFVDADLYSKQAETARAREAVNEPWYSEWESGNQKLMQQAFTKQATVDDAMKGMVSNAKKLIEQNR